MAVAAKVVEGATFLSSEPAGRFRLSHPDQLHDTRTHRTLELSRPEQSLILRLDEELRRFQEREGDLPGKLVNVAFDRVSQAIVSNRGRDNKLYVSFRYLKSDGWQDWLGRKRPSNRRNPRNAPAGSP